MTSTRVILIGAKIIAIIGFRFATIDLGGQRIAAMGALDFASKSGRFRLDGLCLMKQKVPAKMNV